MRVNRLLATAVILLAPFTVEAQAVATPAGAAVEAPGLQPPSAGPRLDAVRVGIAPVEVNAEAADPAAMAQARVGQSMALMIVGGAALVTGLVIGGDAGTILALGGAVVGLIGLYHYLR
ncbi:MAG TPA: hypothetical protein VMM17_04440 [Gemmatimonadaceae bacterium]|nr:hypothetical protein [Gemmatimonadaceae bacterium]